MTIYVQRLSDPLAAYWDVDVESSDTIESVKQKLQDKELPAVYDYLKINLFFNSVELSNGSTLSDYNIQKFSQLTSSYDPSDCDPRFDVHAYGDECGEKRFRRLRLLGYL